ncbi:MAG: glycosyltransferase [Caulobacter sp.]|nr:glycosyltransferase [Caulobacter sp.]
MNNGKRADRPLRIVHAANFGFKPVKAFIHNSAAKLSNGMIRGGHNVVNFSVRDVARWSGPFGNRPLGSRSARHILLSYCRAARPDVLVLGHADLIDAETILRIRADLPQLKVMQWNVDWIAEDGEAVAGDFTARSNRDKILAKNACVDATFVSTGGPSLRRLAESLTGATAFLPNAADPSIETARNFEREDLPTSVFFASSSDDTRRFHAGGWRDMRGMVADLRRTVPEAVVAAYGLDGIPPVYGPGLQDALEAAKIGLNISRRNDIFLYSSDRIAQTAGNGLVVCIDRASGFDTVFGDDEFIFYRTEDELFATIDRLVGDDAARRAMAQRSWARYHELFGCQPVARYMLDVLFEEHDPADYVWPTLAGVHPGDGA